MISQRWPTIYTPLRLWSNRLVSIGLSTQTCLAIWFPRARLSPPLLSWPLVAINKKSTTTLICKMGQAVYKNGPISQRLRKWISNLVGMKPKELITRRLSRKKLTCLNKLKLNFTVLRLLKTVGSENHLKSAKKCRKLLSSLKSMKILKSNTSFCATETECWEPRGNMESQVLMMLILTQLLSFTPTLRI